MFHRRRRVIQAACFYRTPLEEALFGALLAQAEHHSFGGQINPAFRPSVAVQQIFSIMKQSPQQAIRMSLLEALFEDILPASHLLI